MCSTSFCALRVGTYLEEFSYLCDIDSGSKFDYYRAKCVKEFWREFQNRSMKQSGIKIRS
jgi:hypothetical protein